jgi:hypothetical protein
MSNKVLIVTPTLGSRDTLYRTCASVKAIGGGRVRHLLTTPNMTDIVAAQGCNVETIIDANGKTLYSALNHAIRHYAHGHAWIGYINDDDYWLDSMSGILDIVEGDNNNDIVYGRVRFINQRGDPLAVSACSPRYRAFPLLASRGIPLFTQQAVLFRSDLFFKLGGFDEKYRLVADTEYWIRAILSGAKCKFVDSVCAAYRLQPGQLSGNTTLQLAETDAMLKQHVLDGNRVAAKIEEILFKAYNIPVYLNRIYQTKGALYKISEHLGR